MGLEHHLQAFAIAHADTVGAPRPAARVEQLIGLVDAELPARILRPEALRRADEIGRDLPGAAEDLLLDSAAVDQEGEGVANCRIGEEGVHGLHARALAVDLRPRIRLVELHVCDAPTEGDQDLALAALLEPQEYVVLDGADLRRVVVLAGLEHGACCRDRVAAALDLQGVEERPVGHVIARIELGLEQIAGLKIDEAIWARADGLEVGRRLA